MHSTDDYLPHAGELQQPVPASHHALRLDQALALLLPEMGLRGRKRCIEEGRVLLDGKPAKKGQRVRQGQTITLLPPDHAPEPHNRIAILARNETFAALHKPAGLHAVMLAGGGGGSVEELLPRLFPGAPAVCLLNRLDRDTSGILLAGLTAAAPAFYRDLEDKGEVDKRYLAILQGRLERDVLVDRALDTARRRVTKVLEAPAAPLRQTLLRPFAWKDSPRPLTLVEARIRKGARHQIRAHCAHLGMPILGDEIYAPSPEAPLLHLHHCRLSLPGFSAYCPPTWVDAWPDSVWKHLHEE